ncbi:MAG: hypothetical protein ACJASQ_002195 [Crocinitomicaceae bacterium]|jgi:hypothetical protein
MKKLHTILVVQKLIVSTNINSSNRINSQDLVLVFVKDISKRSENNYHVQRKGVFHHNVSGNLSETSIMLSLVEYSRLRERI